MTAAPRTPPPNRPRVAAPHDTQCSVAVTPAHPAAIGLARVLARIAALELAEAEAKEG